MIEDVITVNYNEKFFAALDKLNDAQRRAVETTEGPVLVIAGPGTGKTQIIAARIGHILSSKLTQAQPQNILCLTYTDAGAIAMRKRLLDFIGPTAYRVNIYTFHAFCNEVIQSNLDFFGKRMLEPISDLEKVNLLREIIDGLSSLHPLKRLRGDLYSDLSRLDNLFSMMKEEDWSPEFIRLCCDAYISDLPKREQFIYKRANVVKGIKVGDLKTQLISKEEEKMAKLIAAAELFPLFQEKMLAMNRYDYSDMILWVIAAFKEDENMLRNYQERFLYFLVDEFQDTNGAQNEILSLLTSFWPNPNVFCVGDDDQSIYEFQGARIENIREFVGRNKETETIVLTENYRSTQVILDAARCVIENNTERLINLDSSLNKDLTAALPEMEQSAVTPVISEYPNIMQEEAGVISKIMELKEAGVPLNEIAVIYYRHAQAENIIQLMQKKGIAYKVRKRINILDLPLVRNLLSLLQFVSEEARKPHSAEFMLFEILHFKFLGIDPYDIITIAVHADEKKLKWRQLMSNEMELQQLYLRGAKNISDFEKHVSEWIADTKNLTLQILLEKVLNESGILNYILKQEDKVFLLQMLSTFFAFVKAENTRHPRMKIQDLLTMIEQMDDHRIDLPFQQIIHKEDGVNFTTCHSAKGLEFRYVFVIGCTSDKWESARGGHFNFSLPDTLTHTQEENRIESTRRLFYVAITRAKEFLYISYAAKGNDGKERESSQFIHESQLPVEQVKVSDEVLLDLMETSLQPIPRPKIELFDEEYIRSALENFALSPTSLNSYLDCPIRFYFEQILPLPVAQNDSMAFGTCIHESLRKLFEKMKKNHDIFPEKEILISNFESLMRDNRASFTEKQFSNRGELGKQLLGEYYDRYVNEWNKIMVFEYMIRNVEVDGVPIKGKLDKIEFNGNDVNVVDYKTGKPKYIGKYTRPPSTYELPEILPATRDEATEIYGGDYWRQLVFYKILLDHQRFKKWNMVSGEIDYLEKNENGEFEKRRISISNDDTRFVRHLIKSSYEKIMNHEFSVGCGKEDCAWCGFVRENFPQVA